RPKKLEAPAKKLETRNSKHGWTPFRISSFGFRILLQRGSKDGHVRDSRRKAAGGASACRRSQELGLAHHGGGVTGARSDRAARCPRPRRCANVGGVASVAGHARGTPT